MTNTALKKLFIVATVCVIGCGAAGKTGGQAKLGNGQQSEDPTVFFHEDFSSYDVGDPLPSWGSNLSVLTATGIGKHMTTQQENLVVIARRKVLFPPNFSFEFQLISRSTRLTLVDSKGDEFKVEIRFSNNGHHAYLTLPGAAEVSLNVDYRGLNGIKLTKMGSTYKLFCNGTFVSSSVTSQFSEFVEFRILVSYGSRLTNFRAESLGGAPIPRETAEVTGDGVSKVDIDIPKVGLHNPNAVAVVIGISKFQHRDVPPVNFARNDASTIKRYLINQFGYYEKRIIEIYDDQATLGGFKRIFEEKLPNMVRPSESDVFIYYSGHGAPDPETKEAFFVPYDCDPSYAKSTGYKVQEMFGHLSRLNARSVTVVLDACFSGSTEKGALIKGISPVFVSVQSPILAKEGSVVFTSTAANQVSSWYYEKRHGLFTYYFLEALRGEADGNRDGTITLQEMEVYVVKHVSEQARYLSNREQTPQVMSLDKRKPFAQY
jgi:hypothetical protein